MKSEFVLILIIASVSAAPKSPAEDESLINACTHYGGQYLQPSDDFTGPKCTMEFNLFTNTQVEADELCSLYAPWRLVKATSGKKTVCEVEATLRCESGWVQMFGQCYKLLDQKYTLEAANAACAAQQNSHISRIPHRYAVGVWKRTFPRISQTWMNPSEAFHAFIVDVTPGSQAIGLAFSGKHYEFFVKPNSLVRVDKDWKLQALCEYEPPMTLAEIRRLGERYSEIYYPTVQIDNGMLIRSASFYTRPSGNQHHETCKGVLKALRSDQLVEFHPDKAGLAKLDNYKAVSFARSAGVALLDLFKMKRDECYVETEVYEVPASRREYANYRLDFSGSPGEPKHNCDNLRSSAIMHKKKGDKKAYLRSMSDAQPGPLFCKFGFTKQYTYNQPPGSVVTIRSDGSAFAHLFVNEKKSWDAAEAYCKTKGAHLSGFDTYNELMDMLKVMPEKRASVPVWLGARRKPECGSQAFNEDENDACSRSRVMKWQNGVASNKIESSWWLNDSKTVLNPTSSTQKCMSMYREQDASWAEKGQKGRLDDDFCENEFTFFCQHKLQLTEV